MRVRTPSDMFPENPAYDVTAHAERVRALYAVYPLNNNDACCTHLVSIVEKAFPRKNDITDTVIDAISSLYQDNDFYVSNFPAYEIPDYLAKMEEAFTAKHRQRIADQIVVSSLRDIAKYCSSEKSTATVALLDLMSREQLAHWVNEFLRATYDGNKQLFPALSNQIVRNAIYASGYTPETHKNQRLTAMIDHKGSVHETAAAYLAKTPLLELLQARVPFSIPLKTYREHGFMYAKSGHGKTASMRTLVAGLLDQDCSLFLIDGNGGLIKNLDKIASIKDRLVIYDPDETPALNFFKMKVSQERQLDLYFYLFQALEQTLTPQMATMVSYLVELMQHIPNATLDTLRELCEKKDFPIDAYLPLLPQRAQDYINFQFRGKDQGINQTKSLIARRLHGLNSYPKFLAMFNAPENSFDAYKLMQEKKIVIIDTSRRKLGDAGSTIFGRFVLAQCLNAAWQRDEHDHLTLIMVDEAKAYIDEHSKQFLSDTRFFNVGLFLATQFPEQFRDGVRSEINTNTSIKFAGPTSHQVASELHRDMRCDVDFILDMKNRSRDNHPSPPYWAEWACYVANTTPRAMRLSIPFGLLESLPTMSAAEHQAMRAANKSQYAQSPPNEASAAAVSGEPMTTARVDSVPPATTDRILNTTEPEATPPKKAAKSRTPKRETKY